MPRRQHLSPRKSHNDDQQNPRRGNVAEPGHYQSPTKSFVAQRWRQASESQSVQHPQCFSSVRYVPKARLRAPSPQSATPTTLTSHDRPSPYIVGIDHPARLLIFLPVKGDARGMLCRPKPPHFAPTSPPSFLSHSFRPSPPSSPWMAASRCRLSRPLLPSAPGVRGSV